MYIDLKQKILRLAEQVAGQHGVEIFDVEILGKGKLLVRVIIDRNDEVTLDECERFSRSLSVLLDVEDPFSGPYTLEVSSPGLDRPLRGIGDFKKYVGKLARIVTTEKIANQNFFVGRIAAAGDDVVSISIDGREMAIPFNKISKARLEIEL